MLCSVLQRGSRICPQVSFLHFRNNMFVDIVVLCYFLGHMGSSSVSFWLPLTPLNNLRK